MIIIFTSLILICIDQLVKVIVINKMYNSSIILVNGVINLTYLENTGGAYGIGSNNTVMFIISNFIIIGLLVRFILLKKDEVNTQILIAVSTIIAGGIGNLIDRIFRGYVIDYIDINPLIKYPVFNIADICVVIRMHNYCNEFNCKYK